MSVLDRFPALTERARRWVDARLPERVPVSPTYIQVEVVNRCNLRCAMCSIEELTRTRARKVLTVDDFAAIAEQFPALQRADLQGIGEPLLNPHLEEIIAWGRERSIDIGFVTNGLLFDEGRAESLLRAGPSHMVFSVDSVDPAVFARIRPKADLDRILATIVEVVATRRRLALDRPHIGIMTVAMSLNLDGLPAVVERAAALGVDGISLKGLNTRPNPDLDLTDPDATRRVIAEVEAVAAAHPALQVGLAFATDRSRLRCRWPWTAAYITAEGRLTPCCNCPDARDQELGDLTRGSFSRHWNGPAYRRFRRQLRDGMPDICAACPDY